MTSACDPLHDQAAALVRGDATPEAAAHLAGCPACAALAAGAASLRADLDLWGAPAPPADLIERTLAGLALAGRPAAPPVPAEPARGRPQGASDGGTSGWPPPRTRRRSSVELLTSMPLEPLLAAPSPSPRRLLLRLVTQAAAAVVLFGVCTAFVAVFYPAVTHALEQSRMQRCHEQLVRLGEAAIRYRAEQPHASELRAHELRRALIEGGYADESDFVCPGHQGGALQERSYVGLLPGGAGEVPASQPLYWDRFGNHAQGFNVVYADGRAETVGVEDFAAWRLRSGDAPGVD